MRRCLVIDDSPLIRKVARLVLERSRFEIEEVDNAQAALDHCKMAMPDAVLLDWHLPGMSAMEFMVGLRGVASGVMPYIVYCTTESDANDIARAIDAGCADYLIKPFTTSDLEAKFSSMTVVA